MTINFTPRELKGVDEVELTSYQSSETVAINLNIDQPEKIKTTRTEACILGHISFGISFLVIYFNSYSNIVIDYNLNFNFLHFLDSKLSNMEQNQL